MPCSDCDAIGGLGCGVCGHDLRSVVCLGDQPLANALQDSPAAATARYPLHVCVCTWCEAVQLSRQVPPVQLFSDYPYYSSQARTTVESARRLARRLTIRGLLGPRDLVVEIGSNDGYLLRHYADAGVRTLGVDPAEGPAEVARAHGVETLAEFFTADVSRDVVADHGRASVVHANNVLAHVPDPGGIIEGVARILDPAGVFVIETPWLAALLRGCEFDTIYHEHRWYWSLGALDRLLGAHGLKVIAVDILEIHGGSLRVYAGHAHSVGVGSPFVPEVRIGEANVNIELRGFGDAVAARVDTLRAWWSTLEDVGLVAGYGAAAKGTMLCNALGVAPHFVVDSTPAKQGLYQPGTGAKIVPPDFLAQAMPESCVILAWNFAAEVLPKCAEYLWKGGQVWTPHPDPRRLTLPEEVG